MVTLVALTVIFLGTGVAAQSAEKKVSISDCRFSSNPEIYLNRAVQNRREANARTVRMYGSTKSQEGAADAASAERRNFIDDEIFNRLSKSNIPIGILRNSIQTALPVALPDTSWLKLKRKSKKIGMRFF